VSGPGRTPGDPLVRSQHLSWFSHHGQVYLFHDLYGYLLQMSPDVAELVEYHAVPRSREEVEAEFAGRFEEEEQLALFLAVLRQQACLGPPEADELTALWDFYPVPARWVVFHQPAPETLTFWRTDRTGRAAPETVPPWAARLWRALDGDRSLASLAMEALDDPSLADEAEPRRRVLETLTRWVHHDRQYAKLSPLPVHLLGPEHAWPPYLRSTMPYAPWRPGVDPDPEDPLDVLGEPIRPPHAYYEEEVADAPRQLSEVETTLSHLFRDPHPALGGASYGERLADALVERGRLGPRTRRILEVGGGLGHVAAGVLGRLRDGQPDVFERVRYTIADISPALRSAQRSLLASRRLADRVEWVACNVEVEPPPADDVDLLLCNEVVGDLTTVKLTREMLADPGAVPDPAGDLLRRWEPPLSDAPDELFLNVGALRFVEWLAGALAPGGSAFVSEYGERDRYPVPALHLDHLEFSIHFALLEHVASRLSLETELVWVMDLVGLDQSARMLESTRTWLTSLQGLLRSHGVTLDKRAWTRDELVALLPEGLELGHLGDVRFRAADERCMGLCPHQFKALLLRRPGG